MRPITSAALLLAVSACASTVVISPQSKVKEALPEAVKDCEFMQSLTATSPMYGVHAAAALQDLRSKLFEAAEASGATHLVLTKHDVVYGSTTSHAHAFRCPAK
jgi:hypothetical protein